jgi:pyridoxal 5'-phosphate synthase pdxT subunit
VSTPVIGVFALQGDVREHLRALDELGARGKPVRRPRDLDGIDGIVLPGGESTTMAKLSVDFGLLDPLRSAIASGLPAFGSCAGMIMLADRLLDGRADQQTIGGLDITVRRNAFGRQVDSFESDLDTGFWKLPGDGSPLHAVFIRAPWVEAAGPDVEVLATAIITGAADRIVAVRQGHLLATSFHPELTDDSRVHAYFVDIVRGAERADPGGQA